MYMKEVSANKESSSAWTFHLVSKEKKKKNVYTVKNYCVIYCIVMNINYINIYTDILNGLKGGKKPFHGLGMTQSFSLKVSSSMLKFILKVLSVDVDGLEIFCNALLLLWLPEAFQPWTGFGIKNFSIVVLRCTMLLKKLAI